ncbi:hypothetical protein GAYE_PCTG71G1536 [Galdieria yellowstonensis]|uniref:Eukaryotic translation initiation factor 3 subunit E n=1 Tax=Galdieria yellowstonensis TaxID=3028027 RepID=A0AAV9I8G3_9RHOD|nr:hypothetical protein GAYE_PCTG71G1536 [Galdieria yellowstonensis]
MEYDLTRYIGEHLDRHMVFPLLEFLHAQGIYDEQDILKEKYQLLQKTNMIDFAADVYRQLTGNDPPPELMERRDKVVFALKTLSLECERILKVIEDDELVNKLKEERNFHLNYLQEHYEITAEDLEALFDYARFQYDCGNYAATCKYLSNYLQLQTHSERHLSALWGRLASNILMQEWDAALEDMMQVRDAIDTQGRFALNPLQQLQHRTWLIHWSLFVFFNHPTGRNGIIDLFFQDKYLNTIQTNCPHILRYLTSAVITNSKRRHMLKELVKIVQQESHAYRDPITEFVECLYVNYDFEGAQDLLQKCETTLKHDFFLIGTLEEFLENARLFVFEIYCRIHQVIDLNMLAAKLNMDRESAERWIVNLIRNARLDAKVDSQASQVIMGVKTPSVYEQIVDSTKGLIIRTQVLGQNIQIPFDLEEPSSTVTKSRGSTTDSSWDKRLGPSRRNLMIS